MASAKTKTARTKTAKRRSVGEEPTLVQVCFARELLEAVDQEAQSLSNPRSTFR